MMQLALNLLAAPLDLYNGTYEVAAECSQKQSKTISKPSWSKAENSHGETEMGLTEKRGIDGTVATLE
jgi:hypothetical protein